MHKVRTCLWFNNDGEEAARFYVSLLPGSSIEKVFRTAPSAPALVVNFVLAGTPYQALNGGTFFKLNEAASISVLTADQAETDRLWSALIADGGEESRCGWLKDRYGLSWQIIPEILMRLNMHEDQEAAARSRNAMLQMRKIDIAAIEAAFAGR